VDRELPQGGTLPAVLIGGLFFLGLVFGSFANVVIHRVPEGASFVRPPSSCPQCGAPIRPADNIPVVSWLVLRGRCRDCGAAIPARYPAVEVATGLAFAAVGWRIGLDPALGAFLLFAWTLVVLSVIDARTRKIPNRLTYPLAPALTGLLVLAALVEGDVWLGARAVLGGLAAFGVLLVIALISPRGMGMGDVKLAGFIGLGLGYLGWPHVLLGIFVGFLAGAVIAVFLIVTKLRGRKDLIPFGPYLAAGGMAALLAGDELWVGYLRLSGIQ
jgi:leader peptidase (prepilin peptidase) / N-methyltransferase